MMNPNNFGTLTIFSLRQPSLIWNKAYCLFRTSEIHPEEKTYYSLWRRAKYEHARIYAAAPYPDIADSKLMINPIYNDNRVAET